jgi:hypothetical protein
MRNIYGARRMRIFFEQNTTEKIPIDSTTRRADKISIHQPQPRSGPRAKPNGLFDEICSGKIQFFPHVVRFVPSSLTSSLFSGMAPMIMMMMTAKNGYFF